MPSTHYRRIRKGRQAYHHPPAPLPKPPPEPVRRPPVWIWAVVAAIVLIVLAQLAR